MRIGTRIPRPSASMVVATAALVIAAAGGGAIAANTINGSELTNNSVAGAKLKNRTLTNGKIANNAINNRNIQSNSILQSTLAPGAISTVLRMATQNISMGETNSVQVNCNSGEDVVGGGFGGLPATVTAAGTQANVLFSRPATSTGQAPTGGQTPIGWNVGVENLSTSLASVSVYVICLDA